MEMSEEFVARLKEKEAEAARLTRRRFMIAPIWGFLLLILGTVVYAIVRYLAPPPNLTKRGGGKTSLSLASLQENGRLKFNFEGRPALAIWHENSVWALSAVCTHLGCVVDWDPEKGQIICPCHGAVFDVNGNVLGGPAPAPLPTYTARLEGQKVIIERG